MKTDENKISQRSPLKRTKRIAFVMNDEEMKTLNRFLDKYKVRNKSRWLRETIITTVLHKFEEDYPTLFSENEMK